MTENPCRSISGGGFFLRGVGKPMNEKPPMSDASSRMTS